MKKIINVTRAFLPPFDAFVEGLKPIWETGILTNQGPIHNQLIEALKQYLNVREATLFVNGHQALEIALRALGVRGEVITTPFSFASTTHAIVQCGLTPVFCDIQFDDYTIDTTKLESLITEKTCAILPVHVYGNPCNLKALDHIAKKHNLKILYDAAHTFGVQVDGRGIGSYGHASMFSFHATKVFNTIEGGGITTDDPDLVHQMNLLKNFGIAGPEDVLEVGTNAKMNEIQALMGLINLQYVEAEIASRQQKVTRYRRLLSEVKGVRCLQDQPGVRSNYAYFPILVDETQYGMNRNQLFDLLASHQIHARKYFYPLITDYACYRDRYQADLPVSTYVADRVMTLPLWGSIPDEVIDDICEIIHTGAA